MRGSEPCWRKKVQNEHIKNSPKFLLYPHTSVCGFDEMGKSLYNKETRADKDIQYFQETQDGIAIANGDFLGLVVEEPFFNRMTNITDLL